MTNFTFFLILIQSLFSARCSIAQLSLNGTLLIGMGDGEVVMKMVKEKEVNKEVKEVNMEAKKVTKEVKEVMNFLCVMLNCYS